MIYKTGDLFADIESLIKGPTVLLLPHVCNNAHKWGAGFLVPLGKRFPEAVAAFFRKKDDKIGVVQFVQDENLPIIICNMFAQKDIQTSTAAHQVTSTLQYLELQKCMIQVGERAKELIQSGKKVQIACPKFGSGLAGGNWTIIENMIIRLWSEMPVTVYQL